jgi:hypothetical protein
VLWPININSSEGTQEKLIEINVAEDRKMGISSIKNIGGYAIHFRNQLRKILGCPHSYSN